MLFAITAMTMFDVGGHGNKLFEWILNNWEGSASDAAIIETARTIMPAIVGSVISGGGLALVAISKTALRKNATSYNEFKPVRNKLLHDQEVRLQHFDTKGPVDFGWKNNVLLGLSASTFGVIEVIHPRLRPYRVMTTTADGREQPEVPANLSLRDWWQMVREYYNPFEREGRRNFLRSFVKLFALVFVITMVSVLTTAGIALALTPVSWAIGGAIMALYAVVSLFKWWRNYKVAPADQSVADNAPAIPMVAADVAQAQHGSQFALVAMVEAKSVQSSDAKAIFPESELSASQEPISTYAAIPDTKHSFQPMQKSPSVSNLSMFPQHSQQSSSSSSVANQAESLSESDYEYGSENDTNDTEEENQFEMSVL